MSGTDKIALFRNMADADPDNELAHFSLGKLYFDAGNIDDAVVSLRRTIAINSQHSMAHRLLGEALLRKGERNEAIRVLTDGVRLAHVRGEHMPRNAMIDILRREGVEPPKLIEDDEPDAAEEEGQFLCKRCLRRGEPLDEAPFTNELGTRIRESICCDCWDQWMAMSIKVINEYRLNPATPEGSRIYDTHMIEFLGLGG
jgi:Fe-S cluster biosynthesis and repair protein YggX